MRSQQALLFGRSDHAQCDAVFRAPTGAVEILCSHELAWKSQPESFEKSYFGLGKDLAPSGLRERLDSNQWRVANAALDTVDNGWWAMSDGIDQFSVIVLWR